MTTIAFRGQSITLAQVVKAAGLDKSGGQAKMLVRGGTVFVNGKVERQPGRKLVASDSFRVADGSELKVI